MLWLSESAGLYLAAVRRWASSHITVPRETHCSQAQSGGLSPSSQGRGRMWLVDWKQQHRCEVACRQDVIDAHISEWKAFEVSDVTCSASLLPSSFPPPLYFTQRLFGLRSADWDISKGNMHTLLPTITETWVSEWVCNAAWTQMFIENFNISRQVTSPRFTTAVWELNVWLVNDFFFKISDLTFKPLNNLSLCNSEKFRKHSVLL